ncbi:spermatogenesis-associated protein 31E1-like [Cavia porcellus]|uniref:spermatogenesis-associated protein 31E1-like n=1 Tax=Cavia porcellus TaxID=10141 RepID=UPI002FDFB68F
MLENLVSLLKSICTPWLSLSSNPWAMDMILAFVGGLGIYLVLLPFLPDKPSVPTPTPTEKKRSRRYHMVKKDWSRIRKRSCPPRARRYFWEEGEEINDLDSLLHSHLGNPLQGSRLNQFSREDARGEKFQPLSARADRASRQPLEDMFVTASSSLVSQIPSVEHLPFPTSTLSSGLKTLPVSLGSQSPVRASSPPEPSGPLRCPSPQPFSLSSSPLHSPGPMASPPPLPDPGLALPQQDSSLLPLGTIPRSSSPPNQCSLPSPVPAISILGHSVCAISALPQCQEPPTAVSHSSLSNSEAQGGHFICQSPVASFLADNTFTQVENGSSHFLNPDVQEVLEILITKKVELKISKMTKENGQDRPLYSLGNILKSLGKEQDPIMSQPFWKTKEEAEYFPALPQLPYVKIFGDHVQHTGSQFFWGLPVLHSESLVENTRVTDASVQFSTMLFNGLCNYVPAQIQSNVSPQLYPPRPQGHHLALPHTFTQALPPSQTPSVSQIQTQEHAPSLPIVPCHSPQARTWEVSSLKGQNGKQYPVSHTVQYLGREYLKQPEEKRGFPPVVKRSQKVFSQPADKHEVIQKTKSSGKLPVDVIYFTIREQLEEHLQVRLMCGLPQKVHLPLNKEKDPGNRQAKENCGPSQTSVISDKSSQVIQKTMSECPEISQTGKHSSNDLEKTPKDLFMGLEMSVVNELDSICDSASPRKVLRLLRSDSGNDPAISPGKKNLEDNESIYPSGKVEQTGEGITVDNGHSTLTVDHACEHPGNSNVPMETGDEPSLQGQEYGKNAQDLSILDAGTRQMLEAHLKRLCVRHRWSLAFKVIRVILRLKTSHISLLPQPASSSSASQNSKPDSTHQDIKLYGEPSENIPGENMKTAMSVLKMQGPVTGHSFKSCMMSLPGDDHEPSEAVLTGQETSLTAQPHIYCPESRVQHPDTVSVPGRGSIGSSPVSVMDKYQPQERGGVVSSDTSHQVLTGEKNAGSPCSRDRDIQKTMETEVKKSVEWAVTKEASMMSPSQNLNVSPRILKSPGLNKSLPSPKICTLQETEVSSLGIQAISKKKDQDLPTRVLLQDFATGEVLQDSASEIPLTKDILASQARLPNTRGVSNSSTSPSQGIVSLLMQDRISQGQKEPGISKLQDPVEIKSNTFDSPESGGGFVSPSKMITSHPSPSRGLSDHSGRDTVGQEQKEPRVPKSQEPRMSKSHVSAPPEKKGSFERPKPGGKETQSAGRKEVGRLMPPPQIREVRGIAGRKLQSEKKMLPSEVTIGTRVWNFLQNILPSKDKGEAEPLQKAKPRAAVTQSQGLGTKDRVFRDTGTVEAHVLMSTVGRIVKEKMKQHYEFSASKENLQKRGPQGDRWSSCHKNASYPQQKRIVSNMACGPQARPQRPSHVMNGSLIRDKANNPAFPPREPGPLPGHFHRRPMGAGASEPPVHCSRHYALQRTVFPNQSHNASHIRPGEKSLLSKPALSHTGRSGMG